MSSAELVAWGSGCIDGCADANNNCNGCYLWFHSLCGCIKDLQQPHPQSNCLYFGQITPHSTTPAWVVMNQRDKLTTTERVPGILQVQQNKLYQDGFAFAQKTVDNMYKADGTLALNAVAHRQEEQIHIHLCNNGAKSKVRAVLDGKHPGDYKSLKTVDLSSVNKAYAMWCRAGQAKPIDMAKDIVDYLGKQVGKNDCARYRVGAGFMVSKGYAWSCVTTAGVAEDIFCKS